MESRVKSRVELNEDDDACGSSKKSQGSPFAWCARALIPTSHITSEDWSMTVMYEIHHGCIH